MAHCLLSHTLEEPALEARLAPAAKDDQIRVSQTGLLENGGRSGPRCDQLFRLEAYYICFIAQKHLIQVGRSSFEQSFMGRWMHLDCLTYRISCIFNQGKHYTNKDQRSAGSTSDTCGDGQGTLSMLGSIEGHKNALKHDLTPFSKPVVAM